MPSRGPSSPSRAPKLLHMLSCPTPGEMEMFRSRIYRDREPFSTLKVTRKSLAATNKPSLMDMSTFGLILAVSIRRVVQSFLKPLTQFPNGIKSPTFATLSYVI
jgi:hypothetical protein